VSALNDPRRAEPRGVGSARARDPLRREVQLLGALLGRVIWEQEGPDAFAAVEELRRAGVQRRREGRRVCIGPSVSTAEGAAVEPEIVARAFTLFLLLSNLAEEKHRVRVLARRARGPRVLDESLAAAARTIRDARLSDTDLAGLLDRLEVIPVLTAHPTEARRRTVLSAQRRLARLVDRLDDPRLTAAEDSAIRESLAEELTALWHTALLRRSAPSPLDEVRSAMAFFDQTLFGALPRLYRSLDAALALVPSIGGGQVSPFVRLGSWIGSDRDGHPAVTASVTRATARIQAEHVLRAYERVTDRLLDTLGLEADVGNLPAAFGALVDRYARAYPALSRELRDKYPEQPHRWAMGLVGGRLRRTRRRLSGGERARLNGYASPAELRSDLETVAAALRAQGADRVADGALKDLAWQVDTFGFHLAELELRQHAAVHRAALTALRTDADSSLPLAAPEAGGAVSADEVLDTFRAAWEIQETFGEAACPRYVISFTEGARDVLDVLELAGRSRASEPRREADASEPVALDIVPLLESAAALRGAARLFRDLVTHPRYRAHLEGRGKRQEVMLGYSDSNREIGFLAASWALYRAQADLVAAGRDTGVDLVLFHGRGGAIGRGGGPANRAVLAQPSGSVAGRLKVTQQGEVIAARFADPRIAQRELEQMTHAALVASLRDRTAPEAPHAADRWSPLVDTLAADAMRAYRALVWDDPCFERFFAAATPIRIIAALQLGSRPPSRAARDVLPDLASIRAIPWVFAWSQARIGLPAWFGVGSALAAHRRRTGRRGAAELSTAIREWPFLASTLDAAALGLALADMDVAATYADLAGEEEPMRRTWRTIADEHARSVEELLAATGRSRLLEEQPWLEARIALRNPYADVLSSLQRDALAALAAEPHDDAERARLTRLVELTISGISAGLQHTG
jgi:phosphoenolpyruvate carboxylase